MLIKVTRDSEGLVIEPASPHASKFRAVTVCLTDVTFENGGIVGECVETSKHVKTPRGLIPLSWNQAKWSEGTVVNKRSGALITGRLTGMYIAGNRIWYLPEG